MHLEHIQRGRWILNLSDGELKDITTIAMGFHKGNRSVSLRHIITGGIAVYNDLLKQGYAEDSQFEQSLKTLVEELPEQMEGFTFDKPQGQTIVCPCPCHKEHNKTDGKKFGSAIQEEPEQES